LHQSQVKAYREAAIHSVKEWATRLPLEPMEDGDTMSTFVDRCVSAETVLPPNWKLTNAKAIAVKEIRTRANAIYKKYHPIDEDCEKGDAGTNEAEYNTEDGETSDQMSEDDGEIEDGDVGLVDGTDTAGANATKANQPTKRAHLRSKQKGRGSKNASARKKSTTTKPGYRRGGRKGARGGGRGGGQSRVTTNN